jgi:hypothetical protein
MHDELPKEWLRDPPEILLIGSGVYARSFGQILGIPLTAPESLQASEREFSHGANLLVFSRLQLTKECKSV